MPSIGIGIGLNVRRGGGKGFDEEGRALLQTWRSWLLFGTWDDSVPTSDEWVAYSGWVIDGTWDDATPTDLTARDWDTPDGTPYTLWDDSEVTA